MKLFLALPSYIFLPFIEMPLFQYAWMFVWSSIFGVVISICLCLEKKIFLHALHEFAFFSPFFYYHYLNRKFITVAASFLFFFLLSKIIKLIIKICFFCAATLLLLYSVLKKLKWNSDKKNGTNLLQKSIYLSRNIQYQFSLSLSILFGCYSYYN